MILFSCIVGFTIGCQNDEVAEPFSEKTVFNLDYTIDTEEIHEVAGIDGYYMFSYYLQDTDSTLSHGVGQFAGKMHHYDDENLHKSLEVRIRNSHSGEIISGDLDQILQGNSWDYYGSGSEIYYEVQFTPSFSHQAQNVFWEFGDGQVSWDRFPVHYYKKGVQDKYFVRLTVIYSNGCTDTLESDVNMPESTCSVQISATLDTNRNGIVYSADNLTGTSPFTYEWEFKGGITSNLQQVNMPYTPVTSIIEYAHLKVTDAIGCTTRVALKYNVNNHPDCFSNFTYNVLGENSIEDDIGYSQIEIIYTDGQGNEYSTYNGDQGQSSFFKILNYENYRLNYEHVPTTLLNINFNCVLYSSTSPPLQLTNGSGIIAVGHP